MRVITIGVRWCAVVALLVLSACGGGGGGKGGGGNPAPQPQPQTIAFAQTGELYKFLNDAAYTNTAAGGSGTGAISYSSDAPTVATVDAASGVVTIVGVGTAKITASKAADANYLAASTSYLLRTAPRAVDVTGWVGPTDAELTFSAPSAAALDFTRSSDLTCDPTRYSTCNDGAQSKLDGNPLIDAVARMHRPAMYWLKHGPNVTRGVVAPENTFNRASRNGVVVFNNRLWVMAGDGFVPEELWSSADGSNWRLETSDLPAREESRLVAFQNALWILSGRHSLPFVSNAVWKSGDGKTWAQIPQTAPYSARYEFSATSYNSRLWITGGADGSVYLNDVWSSADGSTWRRETASAAFSPRQLHESIEFAGRLWVIGGYSGIALSDIWSSTDGVTWQQEAASTAIAHRYGHKVIASADRLWLIAGANAYNSDQRDVWTSTDGKTWTLVTANAQFFQRNRLGGAFWQGQLWMIGPGDDDVWTSPTGEFWSKRSLAAVIPRGTLETAIGFKDRLWVLTEEAQFWSSKNGFDWIEETALMPNVSPVFGVGYSQLAVLGEKLIFVSGLQYSAPDYYREVWSSEDGRSWTKLLDAVPFKPDGMYEVLTFKGKLIAFTGDSSPYGTDIWSSSDGANWTRLTNSAAFGARSAPHMLVFNDLLWAIGGQSNAGALSDVWSSPDGINWTLVSTGKLPPQVYERSLAINGQMCLYNRVGSHSVWCSANGVTWDQKSLDAPAGVVTSLNGVGYFIGTSAERYTSTDLVWKSTDGVAWRQGYRNTLRFD